MVKVTIFYPGARNTFLESKILALVETSGGTKGGEWGFTENGFQALFLFRKESIAQDFSIKAKQKIENRIIVNIGSIKRV